MRLIIICILGLSMTVHADFSRNSVLEIVTDTQTRLQWQDNERVVSEQKTWVRAIEYCENLILDGDNWRLPNFNELYYLSDKSKVNPAIDSVFKYIRTKDYWTSTTFLDIKNQAWGIFFSNGQNNAKDKSKKLYIRCVRDGK